jgi:hypothetical protein
VNQVVPFTPAAGLLAWVENTIPLNNYLVGENRLSGAHLRYKRTGDYSFGQCWQKMQRTGDHSKTPLRERCAPSAVSVAKCTQHCCTAMSRPGAMPVWSILL